MAVSSEHPRDESSCIAKENEKESFAGKKRAIYCSREDESLKGYIFV